jgi:hypothetical protein
MNAYITLKTSDLSLVKQFKVLYNDAGFLSGRAQTARRTVTGKLDVQEGSGGRRWALTLRCPYATPDATWGNYQDLYTFSQYKDGGLYLIDHHGDEYRVIMMQGQLEARPLTPLVDGDNAVWLVKIMLESLE